MNSLDNSSLDIKSLIESELQNGEQLRWAGQPDPNRMMKKSLPALLFSIPFTAFSIFWMLTAAGLLSGNTDSPASDGVLLTFFPLFGLPFLGVGIYMFTTPWREKAKAYKTVYAVTNQRAIILENLKSKKVQSFASDKLKEIEKEEFQDGSGDIVLEKIHSRTSKGNQTTKLIGFFGIQEVSNVEKMLREIAA